MVHGDEIIVSNDDGETRFSVKTMLVNRQRPSVCQIFTEGENRGSMSSRETKVYHAKIKTITPNDTSTQFTVDAMVGNAKQVLVLKTVKCQNSECILS